MANTHQKRKKRVLEKDERVKVVNLRFSIVELAEIKKHMKANKIKRISPLIRDTFLKIIRGEYAIIKDADIEDVEVSDTEVEDTKAEVTDYVV